MKYLFVLPGSPAPIGGFKLLYEHGRILVNAGYQVRFLHLNGGLLSEIDKTSMMLRLVRRLRFFWLNSFGKWRNYASREFGLNSEWQQELCPDDIKNTEIIIIASWQLLTELYDKFDLTQVKVIHPVMDYPGYMGPAEKIKSSWEKPISYFCISDYLYASVRSHSNGKQIKNIGCILPGDDVGSMYSERDILGVSRQGILLSFATGKYKNPDGTCELISALRGKFPKEKITVFGRPNRPKSLPSDVIYLQNISDKEVVKLYHSSKVFVFYSNFEGFGLMPLEAMRLGCVVVCTDCFGNRDYIKDEINALIVSPGDLGKTLFSVSKVLDSEHLQMNLVKGGLEQSKKFSPSNFEEVIVEAYANV
ncbi:glycosyltransferase family 4 protein [Haliea sp. AH-315-K21]|nr:glycosyltransferase family 4 protein [Haliea sp. AH-315-K21]